MNEKIIEQWVGEKIVKAAAHFTRDVTGFAIGGVPPVGHKQTITHIFIDEDLLQHNVLWAAAGTPHRDAIKRLLHAAERNIGDSKIDLVSAENRFDAAYKAIMQLANAALQAHGYRTLTSKARPSSNDDSIIASNFRY